MKINCPSCGFVNIEGEDRCAQCLHTLHQRDIPLPKKNDKIQAALLTAPISELLTGEDLLVASPEDTVQKIVKIFQEKKKNCVVVYKKKKLVGILSNRDILWKVVGKYPDLSKVKVADVMTYNPEWVKPNDPIAFAVNKMAMGGFRHIPVINEDGTPLSIILIKDVLGYLAQREKSKAV
jgi:CBS domain-containing protein